MALGSGKTRSPVRFGRIQQLRAHEYVADQIRRHIALRLLTSGEALPSERELAAMFGVGRLTVQHALRLLQADHLVETRRGRRGGTFVAHADQGSAVMEELIVRILRRSSELEELLVYRRAVEPRISRVAAETRSSDDLAAMRREIEAMESAESESDYMRHDTGFHVAVAAATRNRYFVRAIEEIRMQLNDVISLLPESETWHRRISGEHDAIVQGIAARDPQAAEAATELHVARSDQSIRAVLAAIERRGSEMTRA